MFPSYSRLNAPVPIHTWHGTGRQEGEWGRIVRTSWPGPASGWKRLYSHIIGLKQAARGGGGVRIARAA